MTSAAPPKEHRTVPPATLQAPAHITVLLRESVDALITDPAGTYVDGTFGRGGHTRLLLSRLGPQARVFGFDRDPQAIESARQLAAEDARFTPIHEPFSSMERELAAHGLAQVTGVLLDLGVSSPQIDTPERGFSFRFDAPLDMRMDTTRGMTAADWLNTAAQEDIREIIHAYGEERFAARIAAAIAARRAVQPVTRTGELAQIVAGAVKTREKGQDPATRTFQALRIFINRELEELEQVLMQAQRMIRPQGRLAVISFHSLEDRIVKQFLAPPRADASLRHLPVRGEVAGAARWVDLDRIKPGDAEVSANPRSRSAVLRVATRTEAAAPEAQ
jgi:16S rRNA (cytosine1402-N4)-methyltransferase